MIFDGGVVCRSFGLFKSSEYRTFTIPQSLRDSSPTGAAIQVLQADKVFITLAQGTESALSNSGGFEGAADKVDAAVFSRDDLTIYGSGGFGAGGFGGGHHGMGGGPGSAPGMGSAPGEMPLN